MNLLDLSNTEPIQPKSPLAESLPAGSLLAKILLTKENHCILDPNTLATSIDNVLKSVPRSIVTFYKNLIVAAIYERCKMDIPFDVQYTAVAGTSPNPYNSQAKAYGLDKVLDIPGESLVAFRETRKNIRSGH